MKNTCLFLYFLQYVRLFALDFVSQVPLHRIPHCDITRSMIINKKSNRYNNLITFFILVAAVLSFFLFSELITMEERRAIY